MFGVYDLINNNYFPPGEKILCIHTGGLQGNESLPAGDAQFLNSINNYYILYFGKTNSFVHPMYKSVFIVFFFLIVQRISFAQDTLPNISVTQISNKVLISWTNPYTSLTTINIQRSYDSLKNFTTIGSVLNVKAKSNGFVDSKEFKPPQYYRVFISFEGGTYIFTKSHRPGIDTLKGRCT